MKKYLSLISRKTKVKCCGVIILAFISSILATIWPVRLGELYTDISGGAIASMKQGAAAVITFGIIYFAAECITIVRRVLLDCIIAVHESEIRESSNEKLLKMPVSFYAGCMSGEKTAELNQGVAGLSQLMKIMCNDILATVFTAVCILVQVFLKAQGIVAGIMFLYLVLTVMISTFQIRSQNGIREKIVAKKNTLDGLIIQTMRNLEWIRVLNAEEHEKNRLKPVIHDITTTEKYHHKCMGIFDSLKQFCKIFFQVVLIAVSIVLISAGRMEAGSVITVCLLFQQLIKPIDEVYRFMDETASLVIKTKALIRVADDASDEVFDIPDSEQEILKTGIQVKDVIVSNPEKDKNLAWYENIMVPYGKKVALKGENGSGKTSLIRCITRYYPHIQGTITLFGRDQSTYSQRELTEMIYYTPQVSFFIAGTVRDNLLYGLKRTVEDKELINALERVHLVGSGHNDTVICADPDIALAFMIGEKAEELSGGMKQRLSLARAFLRYPRLFIFDEITANLDQKATQYVLKNIEDYAKDIGAGIMYISHDQQVVDRCDTVIQLKNKLREENTYETDRNKCKSRKNEERRIFYDQHAQRSAEAYAAS